MYLKPTENNPSEGGREFETASPFHLGVNPECLTSTAMEVLRQAWGERPCMAEHVRMSYEDNVRVRWNLHSNAIEGNNPRRNHRLAVVGRIRRWTVDVGVRGNGGP